jgi:hypothetical protein
MRLSVYLTILILLNLAIPKFSLSQGVDSMHLHKVEKLAAEIKSLTEQYGQKINEASVSRLKAIKKQEEKLEKLVPKNELARVENLKDGLTQKLIELENISKDPASLLKDNLNRPYLARFDSLESLFKFAIPNAANTAILEDAAQQIKALKAQLGLLGDSENWLAGREQQWRELLGNNALANLVMPKIFGKWQEEVMAYKLQIAHWKETANDPQKIETEALKLLNKLPAFKEFMSKNGELARLFGPPAGSTDLPTGTAIPGLQTRQSLAQELQNRFGANALQSGGALQQQIQNGMEQLSSQQQNPLQQLIGDVQNQVQQLTNGGQAAAISPQQAERAELKSKTFKQRVEAGWNLQSATRIQDFPAVRDVGLSLGYKLNPRSVVGIGVAYKFALGQSWKDLEWTHEGIGLRSFLDWRISKAGSKLLQNIWLTGGFEMNYWTRIANDVQWKDLAWQRSGLVGMTKIVKYKKKEGKAQVFWDYLDNTGKKPALHFRYGFSF